MNLRYFTPWCFIAAITITTSSAYAAEIHVARTGDDAASGTADCPLQTIQRAADLAQPGDTVIVHEGIYREWVKPPRGGTADDCRITYRVAQGEKAIIKGSEQITSWKHESDSIWKAVIPNEFFNDYNPYALLISGGWLHYGQWHHRGDVYLDEEALLEKQTPEEVATSPQSWCCETDVDTTTIRANFGDVDPNEHLAEINVRECVFFPDMPALNYITVDGFHLMHSAENWQPPVQDLQKGMIGTRMGKHWTIENCTITNARCVGIILGHAPGVEYIDIDTYGDHIIRNNVIRRCGEAGIAGQKGATRSLITGNLVEDTNYRVEFGGYETAGIKFHNAVDTVISDNVVRRVSADRYAGFGIWIDFANQGIRITRNIISDTADYSIFLEMNHGPTVIDHNILIGTKGRGGIRANSEGTVYAHNLFVDCVFSMVSDLKRNAAWYEPHTTIPVGKQGGIGKDNHYYNNIFIRRGPDHKQAEDDVSNYNVFLEGAKKTAFGDEHSMVSDSKSGFECEELPQGMTVRFTIDGAPLKLNGPIVDADLIGVLPIVNQRIEDRYANPITIDTDFNNKRFTTPMPGPLSDVKQGDNVIRWTMGR